MYYRHGVIGDGVFTLQGSGFVLACKFLLSHLLSNVLCVRTLMRSWDCLTIGTEYLHFRCFCNIIVIFTICQYSWNLKVLSVWPQRPSQWVQWYIQVYHGWVIIDKALWRATGVVDTAETGGWGVVGALLVLAGLCDMGETLHWWDLQSAGAWIPWCCLGVGRLRSSLRTQARVST